MLDAILVPHTRYLLTAAFKFSLDFYFIFTTMESFRSNSNLTLAVAC